MKAGLVHPFNSKTILNFRICPINTKPIQSSKLCLSFPSQGSCSSPPLALTSVFWNQLKHQQTMKGILVMVQMMSQMMTQTIRTKIITWSLPHSMKFAPITFSCAATCPNPSSNWLSAIFPQPIKSCLCFSFPIHLPWLKTLPIRPCQKLTFWKWLKTSLLRSNVSNIIFQIITHRFTRKFLNCKSITKKNSKDTSTWLWLSMVERMQLREKLSCPKVAFFPLSTSKWPKMFKLNRFLKWALK